MSDVTEPAPMSEVYGGWEYLPSEWSSAFFVAFFGLATLIHIVQVVRNRRQWWLLPTVVFAGVGESLGWAARLWGNLSPANETPFLIQITALIVSATPLLAANFIIFAQVIRVVGPQYSRLSPRLYTIIFTTADVVALVVQGAGGGIASSSDTPFKGAHIMLGGIIFQMVLMVIFTALFTEYFVRYFMNKPFGATTSKRTFLPPPIKMISAALVFTMVMLFIRAVYRTIELGQGWGGSVMQTEWMFIVFDAATILVAMFTYNFFHPGTYLLDESEEASCEKAMTERTDSSETV